MKYQPHLPEQDNEQNINVSHDQPLKTLFTLLSGVLAIIGVGYGLLGVCVDFAVDHLPDEVETLIARQFSLSDPLSNVVQDEFSAYLQTMLRELQQCAGVGYPLQLTLADVDQINAFAIPGGQIVVFTGLIDQLESENGLAFVLAHEISHFQNRDHLRSMGRGVVIMGLSALITGADSVITKLILPTITLGEMRFSQSRELAADRRALAILNCRYGHVGGGTEFFSGLLSHADNAAGSVWGHYFDSHPKAMARVERIQQQGDEAGFRVGAVTRLMAR
ncbi:MAG: M48 family metallopeptidase [Immundisolibacteraceae bacterium]|nr:M48 family metallopeptidase [Immundisolibacteraceae bacterium]